MKDWEQTLHDAAEKGLITFGTIPVKSGDLLLAELRRKAEYRNKCLVIAYLFGSPLYQPPWFYWLDYLGANNN